MENMITGIIAITTKAISQPETKDTTIPEIAKAITYNVRDIFYPIAV